MRSIAARSEACAGGAFFPGIEAPHFIADGGELRSHAPGAPAQHPSCRHRQRRVRRSLAGGLLSVPVGGGASEDGLETFLGQDDDYGWWPAQRPDSVFTDRSLETRVKWDAGVGTMDEMVTAWTRLGFVLRSSNARGETIPFSTSRRHERPGYDAVVIGGGPAGCAAALTLARGGAAVALIEQTQ